MWDSRKRGCGDSQTNHQVMMVLDTLQWYQIVGVLEYVTEQVPIGVAPAKLAGRGRLGFACLWLFRTSPFLQGCCVR